MNQIPNTTGGGVPVLSSLINRARLVTRLMRDPRVPIAFKVVPFAALAYVVFPIDIVPDLVPVLGQLDDLGALLVGVEAFIALSPQAIVDEHRAAIQNNQPFSIGANNAPSSSSNAGTVIDGEWREVRR